ncbi:MAG: ankyrin repeat domain-containing protein, partial [bacterium]
LYWISDRSPPKSRSHAFYFCIDNDLVYEPFFADFGPLDLGKVHLFCKELEKLMNVIGSNGWNALHFACYLGYNSIVTLFIAKGANLNKPSLEGWTAL